MFDKELYVPDITNHDIAVRLYIANTLLYGDVLRLPDIAKPSNP